MHETTSAMKAVQLSFLTVMLTCCLAGCGGDDVEGYHLSGEVTFDGEPIQAGRIVFKPDSSQENSGPSGYASIKDGRFDTKSEGGKQHVGGAMIVEITGMEPAGEAEPDPENPEEATISFTQMFPTYRMPATLPEEDGTQDFNVPAEAADVVIEDEEGSGGGGP